MPAKCKAAVFFVLIKMDDGKSSFSKRLAPEQLSVCLRT